MKIGFVIHFFDFRNDVRKLIKLSSSSNDIVLFAKERDIKAIKDHISDKIEIRTINEREKSFINIFWENLYKIFGMLPKSVRNYYLMEVFKISSNPSRKASIIARIFLFLRVNSPRFISYDKFLSKIRFTKFSKIDDVDHFVCFTEISHDYFFSRLIKENKKISVYVYSWDHPCKHFRFSKKVNYLVWSQEIKNDLINLQGIDENKIKIFGSSQFGYIHQFQEVDKSKAIRKFNFNYIYFGCAIGIADLSVDEINLIKKMGQLILESKLDLKLVVRPYPNLKNWQLYEELKKNPVIILDDDFRTKDLSIGDSHILEKFFTIHFAKAFIHLGTTLGLEACFTDTPSIIFDFDEFNNSSKPLSIKNFVHQFQNEKYLLLKSYPNVISSWDNFQLFLQEISSIEGKSKYLPYNHTVRRFYHLKSFEGISEELINNIRHEKI